MKLLSRCLCLGILSWSVVFGAISTTCWGAIRQQITLSFDNDFDPFTDDVFDGDSIEGATEADIDRPLIASIVGDRFSASGSVGEFGTYGVQGSLSRVGELRTQVVIEADVAAPPNGLPREAEVRFIIDGGRFFFVGGEDSTMEYTLTLSVGFDQVFQSYGVLSSAPGGFLTEFETGGADIGAVQSTTNRNEVLIPFSFQKASLGVLQPGEVVNFEYQLDIITTIPDVAEVALYEFQDPLSLTPPPVEEMMIRPSVAFVAVPEPGTAGLLSLAVVGGCLVFWPRRR